MTSAGGKHALRLAADLDVMWADLPVLDRIDAAGDAGFEGIALSAPYDLPAKDLQRAALRAGVTLVRIATPPPNYTGGDLGFAAVPGGEARFEHDLRRALRYCSVLQVPMLQLLAGPGNSDESRKSLRSNLERAAETAPAWMQFVIGPERSDNSALSSSTDCIDLMEGIETRRLAVQLPCELSEDGLARIQRDVQRLGARVSALVLETEPDAKTSVTLSDFAQTIARPGFKGWLIAAYSSNTRSEDKLAWMKGWSATVPLP